MLSRMINKESILAVENSIFSKGFRKPLYESYCFAKIPDTIAYLLTGKQKEKALPKGCYLDEGYEAVILLFIDAFGWRFWQQFKDHPLIQRFEEQGIVSKITSQFPSTTAAHVTTIHTGLTPAQSGIYEWYQYEPKVDRVIAPLLFSYAGDDIHESLLATKISPQEMFPFTSFYERLHKEHIDSFLFHEAHINQSSYSQAVTKGAHLLGYLSLQQGLRSLRELQDQQKNRKTYSFLYHSHIDFVGHRKGIESAAFRNSILYCLDHIEKELIPTLEKAHKKTALLVTADHAMVSISPHKTLYINKVLPHLKDSLVVQDPAGSCRDLFLKIKEEERNAIIAQIRNEVEGMAEVWKIEDLIDHGVFGKGPLSDRFMQRVGNTVILPYDHQAVWWLEKHRFEQHFYGSHGGLTPEEMETVFAFLSFGG